MGLIDNENPGLAAAREERCRMADELREAGFREGNGGWVDINGRECWGTLNAHAAMCKLRRLHRRDKKATAKRTKMRSARYAARWEQAHLRGGK